MKAMQETAAAELQERAKKIEVLFNNYPNDTFIVLNGGSIKLVPGLRNVTLKGVTSAAIKKETQDLALCVWLIDDLEKIKSITVKKVVGKDNEYQIVTEPGSVLSIVKAKDPQGQNTEALLGMPK